MPDGLYDQDILAWSTRQADLLRRFGRGERVNDVDWDNIAEEIESVGRSELHAVQSYLRLIIVHLLKLHNQPNADASSHWRSEIAGFQDDAITRFTPSMRQRLDIDRIYAAAVKQLCSGDPATASPTVNPFTLDDLLNLPADQLMERLTPS